MSEPDEFSPSGQPIYRHKEREREWQPPDMHDSSMEAIEEHFERFIGKPESVFHEIISDLVHIDVHLIPPSTKNNHFTLFTTGMSDLPMKAPEGAEDCRYAEIMVKLPASWKLDQDSLDDEANYWPLRCLKMLARMPHEYDTWLSYGHTVPNGDPPEPYAPNTKLCCALLLPPVFEPDGFASLFVSPEKTINILEFYPIYLEEMNLKLSKGTDGVTAGFDKYNISPVLDVQRRNVARKRLFGIF